MPRSRNDEVHATDLVGGCRYYTGINWVTIVTAEPVTAHKMRVTYRLADEKLDAKLGEQSITCHWDRCWYLTDSKNDITADQRRTILDAQTGTN